MGRTIPIDSWNEFCENIRKQVDLERNEGTTKEAITKLEDYLKREDIKRHPMFDVIEMCLRYAIDQLRLSLSGGSDGI